MRLLASSRITKAKTVQPAASAEEVVMLTGHPRERLQYDRGG